MNKKTFILLNNIRKMLNKPLCIIILLIISLHLKAQVLDIPQTLEFMNELLVDIKKSDGNGVEFYQTITLEDDTISFKYIGSAFSYEMDTKDLLVDLVSAKGNWFRVRNKVKGIVVCDKKTKTKSIRYLERIYINEANEITKKRFAEAFKYLIRLIKDEKNGITNDVDNDMKSKFINSGKKDRVTIDVETIDDKPIIKVEICGINKKFILDYSEFASTISLEVEKELLNKHIITKRNYLDNVLYRFNNGDIRMSKQIIIPKIQIGDFKVFNSRFFVTENDSYDLTLGKSFLNFFGEWDIIKKSRKNKVLTLHIK